MLGGSFPIGELHRGRGATVTAQPRGSGRKYKRRRTAELLALVVEDVRLAIPLTFDDDTMVCGIRGLLCLFSYTGFSLALRALRLQNSAVSLSAFRVVSIVDDLLELEILILPSLEGLRTCGESLKERRSSHVLHVPECLDELGDIRNLSK